MRVSVNITNFSWSTRDGGLAEHLVRVLRAAEAAALHTVWVGDHLLQADPTCDRDAEMLEAYTTLGFIAAHTQRVRIGTMVTAATFRPPALLVKAVTTLDVLSGGRAWFGVGAGHDEAEAREMGLPLPPKAERAARLEEVLRIAHHMWSGERSAFLGTHYQLQRPVNSPMPVHRPRPPILVGGSGERRTLPLVARYADACNLFDLPDSGQTVRHKLAVLEQACAHIGRPFGEIETTLSTRLGPDESPEDFTERCIQFAKWGIQHAVVIKTGPWTPDDVARLSLAAREGG